MGLEGNQNIIRGEQGRLDKLDAKIDKKIALSGKDYSDIVFKKVDTTIAKLNTDFGIKNEAILKDQKYQEMKAKSLNGITQALFELDQKNISELAGKLDKLLTAIEQGGDKMRVLDNSLSAADKLAQQLKELKKKGDIDGMIKATREYLAANEQTLNDAQKVDLLNQLSVQLLAQSEKLRQGEVVNVKGVEWRVGDAIVASRTNMETTGIKREIKEIAKIEKIDTKEGITLAEGTAKKTIVLADFIKYLDDSLAIQNQYGREKNPFNLGNNRRIIAVESPSDALKKEAQEAQQKAALIAMKDLVVKGSAMASCKDFTPKSPRTGAFIKEGSITIDTATGAVNFTKELDRYSLEDQQAAVDELVQFLKEKGANQKIEDAKSPEEKLFYQAELSLQKGQIGSARADCIKFIQSADLKTKPELIPLKEKAEGYLKGMWLHSMNELKQANETMFGKAAIAQVRDKMKYGLLKGDTQQMKRFEEAFQIVHNQASERIDAASQDSKTDTLLQDPTAIFKNLPQPSGENSKEITACQEAWQRIAIAQTMDMRTDSSGQKQERYADAADALRALGLYDFSQDFVKKGLRNHLDLTKNSEVLKAKKLECVMRLNTHREEYATRVKAQFLEQTRDQPGRPELSEQQWNKLIDQAIDRAADQQIDALLLKAAVSQMDEGGLQGSDARLAQIYKNIENPNENLLTFSDKEISALGDKVIHFAAETAIQAALMAVSGGVANIASAGIRTALMTAGAREALAGAAGFMANAAAFEVATKAISPYVTGGPGFTTAEDFALDYGKSLLMFGALHRLGKFSGAAAKEAGGVEAMSLAQKATIYGTQLGTEVAVLAELSELEAARDGKLASMNGVHLLGENVATVLGLRAGTQFVHASGANEAMAKAAEGTAKFVDKAGTAFVEGFNKSMNEQILADRNGQVAYGGVPMAQPVVEGLKSAFREVTGSKTDVPVPPRMTEPAQTEIPKLKVRKTKPLSEPPTKPLSEPAATEIPGANPARKTTQLEVGLTARYEVQNVVDAYAKSPNRTETLKSDIADSFKQIDKGETPGTDIGKAISKIKQTDPTGYEHLKNSNLADLLRTSCFEAILYGQRETMSDVNGKAITIYKGNDIGNGGMGVVAHVAYTVEGSSQLKFGAIKRPHPGLEKEFKDEVQGALTIAEWNNPNIIKPIHIGNERIIYETSEQATDLRKPYESAKPAEYFDMLIDVGKGLIEYRNHGLFHGDMKEMNVMRLQTGVDAQGQPIFKTVIIDNTPQEYGMSIKTRSATEGYCFKGDEILKGVEDLYAKGFTYEQVVQHFGRATDVRAYGQMIENAIHKKMPNMLNDPVIKELISQLKDPVQAGEPDMLQKAIDAVNIIKTELLSSNAPTEANANISQQLQNLVVKPTEQSAKPKPDEFVDTNVDPNAPSVPFTPDFVKNRANIKPTN